jgi:hypothetical protein
MAVDLRKFRWVPSWDSFFDNLECETFAEMVDMLPATREEAAEWLIEQVEWVAEGVFGDVDVWGTPEEQQMVEVWDDKWSGWAEELRSGGDLWVIAEGPNGRRWMNVWMRRVPLEDVRLYVGF